VELYAKSETSRGDIFGRSENLSSEQVDLPGIFIRDFHVTLRHDAGARNRTISRVCSNFLRRPFSDQRVYAQISL